MTMTEHVNNTALLHLKEEESTGIYAHTEGFYISHIQYCMVTFRLHINRNTHTFSMGLLCLTIECCTYFGDMYMYTCLHLGVYTCIHELGSMCYIVKLN